MIKNITMSSFGVYQQAMMAECGIINLVYGLNGTGKTVLSTYLANYRDNEGKYISCKIDSINEQQEKILVYNQQFVEENFRESPTQKGIFTVSKDNKNALQKIEQAKNQKTLLTDKLQNQQRNEKSKKEEISDNIEQAVSKIWEIKQRYTGGDRIFDEEGFLNGFKKRYMLFDHINSLPLEEPKKNIDNIKKELLSLGSDATIRKEIPLINILDEIVEIVTDNIFGEEIIGNQNSTVARLITTLSNSDWVKQGIGYVKLDQKECPFCQQETMTPELVAEIKGYFDSAYDNKMAKLESLQRKYKQLKNNLDPNQYQRDFYDQNHQVDLSGLFVQLNSALEDNLEKINTKLEAPAQKVELQADAITKSINLINDFIRGRNQEISTYNKALQNRGQTVEALKKEFWRIQRKEYDQTISAYKKTDKKLDGELQTVKNSIQTIQGDIERQDEIIKDCQKQTVDTHAVINKINDHILNFGISDFTIKKVNETEYKIVRKKEENTEFKSLSEGEKTVITFLYFVELCLGKENTDDTRKKIIVIDDPISSLSHIHVFNVASLIKTALLIPLLNALLKDRKHDVIEQIFILTHNLYFFHEIVSWLNKKEERRIYRKLFRILKLQHSEIKEMSSYEIQNDYQAYWSIVRDAKQMETGHNTVLVANAMRNILEYFFGFIEKKEIDNIIDVYDPFMRYINRESHSDATNISDYKEFDYDVFLKSFKKVFEDNGYKEHYDAMMKIKTK